ncbi:CBS domain-containing protein [Halobacillus litoralis]|uniref:CBS domain-containing protein n=1 Tax=Halobacillus litoralis TaxID=45668 RepID=UPI001CD1D58B|nr:CBS domain-containing protein [Halobacillus litoralis]MCA0970992.1 CBS domain-containing protein [Halobacillus litoralis]
MADVVERFEVAFNQIHQHLKELNGFPKNDNFVELLQHSKNKHSVIRVYFDKLKQYAKLRNAIVHERIDEEYYIATPHLDVVEDLERIKRTLDQPPKALDFATRPVLFFKSDTDLAHIIEAFDKHPVSQFPIYGDQFEFKGLLTNDVIVSWMSRTHQDGAVQIDGMKSMDVLQEDRNPNIQFLKADRTVYDLEERFEHSLEKNEKLKAVILTESGDANEAPVGIVTTWDLIKVDRRDPDE